MSRNLLALTLLTLGAGCAPTALTLSGESAALLYQPPAAFGAHVYDGAVYGPDDVEPVFRYQRRVQQQDRGLVSAHLTYAPTSSAAVVVQRAWHDAEYRLSRFEEVHAQTGVVSEVEVGPRGGLRFTVRRGDRVERTEEGPGAPVVVGPTLFGVVWAHWPALAAGETVPVRFAAADRGQSYDFVLERGDGAPSTVVFRPASALVRLFIDDMFIQLDPATRTVRRYQGRVPPRQDGLRALDARVEYTRVADRYL